MKRLLSVMLLLVASAVWGTISEITRADTAKVSDNKTLLVQGLTLLDTVAVYGRLNLSKVDVGTFADSGVSFFHQGTPTARVRFDLNGVSAGVTRTVTFLDQNVTIGGSSTQLHSLAGTKDTTASIRPDTVVGTALFTGKPNFSIGFSTGGSPSKITDIAPYDAIVDSAGNGDYTTIMGALNAGHKNVGIRKGHYNENVVIPYANTKLTGLAAATQVVINGTTVGTAITVTKDSCEIRNLSVQTGVGGTCNANNCYGMDLSAANANLVRDCVFIDAELDNIIIGNTTKVEDSRFLDADGANVRIAGVRGIVSENICWSSGVSAIVLATGQGSCLVNNNYVLNSGTSIIEFLHGSGNSIGIGNVVGDALSQNGNSTNMLSTTLNLLY